MKWHN